MTIRVAVPNKGSLSDPAVEMLRAAGYRHRRDPRELVLVDAANDVEFFFLRPRDVAVYVGSGTVDVGITGRDMLIDSGTDAIELLPLGFARSTFRFAAPPDSISDLAGLAGKRIATSYPTLVRSYLDRQGIKPAAIVHLDGAVESSIRLGVADAIADVVETGSTLKAAGLEVFGEPIMSSEAILIRNPDFATDAESDAAKALTVLMQRLEGKITAREWVLMDYLIEADLLEKAIQVTPGFESPTVSPTHEDGVIAVRVMVKRDGFNRTMDALYAVGARGIVVSAVLATRL